VFASAVALPNATVLSLSFVGVTHTVVAAVCVGLLPEY